MGVDVRTFNELREKLERATTKSLGREAWVTEIFLHKPEFIVEKDSKYFSVKYKLDSSGEVTTEEPVEVKKEVDYTEK